MPRSDRDLAVAAIAILSDVVALLERPSISRAVALVGRADRIVTWRLALQALQSDLRAPRVEFCNWCPTPTAPDPRWHLDGRPNHVEVDDV